MTEIRILLHHVRTTNAFFPVTVVMKKILEVMMLLPVCFFNAWAKRPAPSWLLKILDAGKGCNTKHFVCMYLCMYRGRPSWRCPWDWAFQLGQGEGPIGIVVRISQPRGIIDTASLKLDLTCAPMYAFRANFTLGSYGWPISSCRRSRVTPGPCTVKVLWTKRKIIFWRDQISALIID